MIKQNKLSYYMASVILIIVLACCFLKYFNLSWVESNTSYAKVTINFLFPMDQANLKNHIHLEGARENQTAFDCSIEWLNAHVVELKLKEQNELKGQKINLVIDKAPTKFKGITKSGNISIQFKADIQLIEPTQKLLVSSTHSFSVIFNTPISLKQLNQYFECEAPFIIEQYEATTASGKMVKDDTHFIFTPKVPLENGKTYTLSFKKGMRSKNGTFLNEDQTILLEVDKKPSITKTYPIDGDKWIGLYPRILLETKEEVVKVAATLNDKALNGTLINNQHAYFLLDELLKPGTDYTLKFQVQVASGEVSELKEVHFTTTTIDQNRFWLDIHIGSQKQIKCYEGNKCIRTIPCQIGNKKEKYLLGTYYLQGKSEIYEDNVHHLGGNYWMMISDKLGIQGALRDSYWQPSNDFSNAQNIVISDEDAAWLYEKITEDTMVIVRD